MPAARCAEARASRAWERRGAALPEPTNLSSRLRASARVDGAAWAGLLGFSGSTVGFTIFAKAIRAILPLMGLATLLVALRAALIEAGTGNARRPCRQTQWRT